MEQKKERETDGGNWVNEVAGEEQPAVLASGGGCVVATSPSEYFWNR